MFNLLLAIIATAVFVQLFRMLGTYDADAENLNVTAAKKLTAASPELSATEKREQFMRGAADAYRMITGALFAGDLAPCKALLEPQVLQQFQARIDSDVQAGRQMRLSENLIRAYNHVSESVTDGIQEVVMLFDVSLRYNLRDATGEYPQSSRGRYLWTFRKAADAPDNAWKLAAVATAADE